MLIIFGGAPGSGKTTLARLLARRLAAVYLRIDTMDHPIMQVYGEDIEDLSYKVAYGLAADNLALGHTVIADCVNDVNITRNAWRDVGLRAGVPTVELEIVCSDTAEHRRRVETRVTDIPGFVLPAWEKVCNRWTEPWPREHVIVDTAGRAAEDCVAELTAALPSSAPSAAARLCDDSAK
jgi:predicted kinase